MKLFACQPQEDILYFFAGILYIYEPWLENELWQEYLSVKNSISPPCSTACIQSPSCGGWAGSWWRASPWLVAVGNEFQMCASSGEGFQF